jgi:hypothetical protein
MEATLRLWGPCTHLARLLTVVLALVVAWPEGGLKGPSAQAEGPITVQVRGTSPVPHMRIESLIATPYTLGTGDPVLLVQGRIGYDGPRPHKPPGLKLTLLSAAGGTSQLAAPGIALGQASLCQATGTQALMAQLDRAAQTVPPLMTQHSTLPFSVMFSPYERQGVPRWIILDWQAEAK